MKTHGRSTSSPAALMLLVKACACLIDSTSVSRASAYMDVEHPHPAQVTGVFDVLVAGLNSMPCPGGQCWFRPPVGPATCSACEPGTYSDGAPCIFLSICFPCPVGRYTGAGGQPECAKCPIGFECDTVFLKAPKACQVKGRYCYPEGTEGSHPCPGAQYCPVFNAPPRDCEAGFFCQTLSASQEPCLRDHFCPAKSVQPVPCPPGTTCPHTGMYEAQTCKSGHYCPDGLQELPCPQGRYSPSQGLISSCYDCHPGTANNRTGQRECLTCPSGWHAQGPGQLNCTACPPGRFSHQGNADCVTCPAGSYSIASATTSCLACPSTGASCANGEILSQRGSWMFSRDHREVRTVPCPRHLCPGNRSLTHQCSANRLQDQTNVMCSVCDEGFAEVAENCVPCQSTNYPQLVIVLIALAMVVLCVHILAQGDGAQSMKVLSLFVSSSRLILAGDIRWLAWLAVLDAEPQESPTSDFCVLPLPPFRHAWVALSAPFAIVLTYSLFGCTKALWLAKRNRKHLSDHRVRYVRGGLALLLLSYSSITDSVLQLLHCVDVEDIASRVWARPAVDCASAEYHVLSAVLWVVLVLVVLGVPVALLLLLSRQCRPKHTSGLDLLTNTYSVKAKWWEVVLVFRRFLTVLVVFSFAETPLYSQTLLTIIFSISLWLHMVFKPFAAPLANMLETVSLLTLAGVSSLQTLSVAGESGQPLPLAAQVAISVWTGLALTALLVGVFVEKLFPQQASQMGLDRSGSLQHGYFRLET